MSTRTSLPTQNNHYNNPQKITLTITQNSQCQYQESEIQKEKSYQPTSKSRMNNWIKLNPPLYFPQCSVPLCIWRGKRKTKNSDPKVKTLLSRQWRKDNCIKVKGKNSKIRLKKKQRWTVHNNDHLCCSSEDSSFHLSINLKEKYIT